MYLSTRDESFFTDLVSSETFCEVIVNNFKALLKANPLPCLISLISSEVIDVCPKYFPEYGLFTGVESLWNSTVQKGSSYKRLISDGLRLQSAT